MINLVKNILKREIATNKGVNKFAREVYSSFPFWMLL